MANKIRLRRGTKTQWEGSNPILGIAEPGAEIDTGRLKIGDGVTAWTALPYVDATVVTPNATTLASGVVELATSAETQTGSDTGRAVTPSGLKAAVLFKQMTKRPITGSYVITAADALDVVLHSTATTGITITCPLDNTTAIGQDVPIPWRQFGAGQLTFAAESGATLLSRGSAFKSAGQNAEGMVTKVGANTWLVSGDLTA